MYFRNGAICCLYNAYSEPLLYRGNRFVSGNLRQYSSFGLNVVQTETENRTNQSKIYVLKTRRRINFTIIFVCFFFQSKGEEFVLITPNNGLYFPAIDYLYREIMTLTTKVEYEKTPFVMNCVHLKGLDYTAAKGLSLISSEIHAKNQRFIVLNASEKMRYVCRKSGCKAIVFCSSLDALPAIILGERNTAYTCIYIGTRFRFDICN